MAMFVCLNLVWDLGFRKVKNNVIRTFENVNCDSMEMGVMGPLSSVCRPQE
jgi:hypothetical protein